MTANKLTTFLKTSRMKAGLSQADVSNAMGYMTPQFVSNWERGVSQPPISELKNLAKIYMVSEEQLFKVVEEVTVEQVRHDLRERFKSSGRRKKI